ncbi:MAG TPA: hypothetical protein VMG12_42975 [Polyangiaceae bacterium]|nr:hypothetical protein [Polyangiaceae bacterium]
MKLSLPLTLVLAAAWGAWPDRGAHTSLPLAAASALEAGGDPPWLAEDWPPSLDALGELDIDPHAGLSADEDPHAGLFTGGTDQEGYDGAASACPADGVAPVDELEPTDADPHATAVGRTALLEAGLEPSVVERSRASNGYTIAELHAQRSQLGERRVRVRGTVIKRTDGILGKSYLHLWDGSSTPETGDDDLTVTSPEELEVGETVELEGRVLVDRDLGIGYRYPVLLDGSTRVGE